MLEKACPTDGARVKVRGGVCVVSLLRSISFLLSAQRRYPERASGCNSRYSEGTVTRIVRTLTLLTICALGLVTGWAQTPQLQQNAAAWPAPQEGDFGVHNFHFQSGETLPEVRMH